MLVPTHPEATADPATLRWVIPDGHLGFTGDVARVPGLLQALIDDGTLVRVEVRTDAVLTTLAPGHDWAGSGAAVRRGVTDALTTPRKWRPASDARETDADEVLKNAARDVADVRLGRYIASHGGRFEVVGVRDGVVDVALRGECSDCAAAVVTMHARFEHLLRRRCPWLKEVRRAA
ncbi:NifU family protein [Corynebacterium frankenforstense]